MKGLDFMLETINLYYIVSNLGKEQIKSYQILFDTDTIKELNHVNFDYYIGFSGFGDQQELIETPVRYDFYYFYNMLEDKQTIYDAIKFEKEMPYIDLINFEIHRLKKLKEQEILHDKILREELAKYKKYVDEMNYWIATKGSPQLKMRFFNKEDIELCYLIERVSLDKPNLYSNTI
jgi:hypothetical protein